MSGGEPRSSTISAVKPADSIRSMTTAGDVPGGIRTRARSDARLTCASTPSSELSLLSIRATQAPQVIPPMERDISVSEAGTARSVAVNEHPMICRAT